MHARMAHAPHTTQPSQTHRRGHVAHHQMLAAIAGAAACPPPPGRFYTRLLRPARRRSSPWPCWPSVVLDPVLVERFEPLPRVQVVQAHEAAVTWVGTHPQVLPRPALVKLRRGRPDARAAMWGSLLLRAVVVPWDALRRGWDLCIASHGHGTVGMSGHTMHGPAARRRLHWQCAPLGAGARSCARGPRTRQV